MKLSVRMVPDTHFGVLPVLCDDQGVALPGQAASSIEWSMDKSSRITVTFAVMEGSDVEFSKEVGKPIK